MIAPFAFLKQAAGGFDPATLALSLYLDAPYSGSPWSAIASAGSSGSNSFSGGTPPSVGAALNGLDTADVDGSTQQLSGAAASTFFSASALTILALIRGDTAGAIGDDQQNIFGDDAGYVGMGFNSNGVTSYVYDGGTVTRSVALATGTWGLAMMKLDGGNLYAGLDGTWGTGLACGNVGDLSGTMRIGVSWGASRYDGRIAFMGAAPSVLSDPDIANIKAYLNARFGLAL